MYRYVRVLVSGGSLILAVCQTLNSADAAVSDPLRVDLPKNLAAADFKKFCPDLNTEPPNLYILERSIVSSYPISLSLLDWNDNGVGPSEIHQAASSVLCLTVKTPSQASKCYANIKERNFNADANAQANIFNDVQGVLLAGMNLKKGPTFNLYFKDGILQVTHKANASAFNTRDRLFIGSGNEAATPPEEFFESHRQYYAMKCMALPKEPVVSAPPTEPGAPVPLSGNDVKLSQDKVLAPLRIRGTTSDLAISRDQDSDFKGVSSATLSITNDNEAHKSTFDGHLAAGYALPPMEVSKVHILSIPYFKMDRTYTAGLGSSKTATNVDNIGFGVQENLLFPINGLFGNLAIQPDYTYSLRSNARVGKLQFAYEVYPPIPFYGKVTPTGWMGVSAYFNAQALFNIGRVFDPGTDTTLTDQTFTQVGTALTATLSSDDSDSPFNGFSVPLTYTYLYGFVGNYKAIQQFTAGVNYALTKYVSIKASHTSGRNTDTFEKQSLYKLSLGLKY